MLALIIFLASCKKNKTTPPVIITIKVSSITQVSANSGGNIKDDGGSAVLSRGICWDTLPNPVISDMKTSDGSGIGVFSSEMEELTPNTTYFVRSYAVNKAGSGYGNTESFKTKPFELAVIKTLPLSSLTQNSAISGGEITNNNGGMITARGVCWSDESNPTTDDQKTSDGTGPGRFSSSLTGLKRGTGYYLKAYAINSAGTAYGNEITFKTLTTSPELSTLPVSSIGTHSARSGGTIISDGGEEITAKGVCWNCDPNPTLENAKTSDGTGSENFTSTISGLKAGSTYHVRAYAINRSGTAYGNDLEFTAIPEVPFLTTSEARSVTSSGAIIGVSISSDGGSPVTNRGVCWSTSPGPGITDSKTTDGTGTGVFISTITGLKSATTYYVRAYATNIMGTSYGEERSFRTIRNQIIADHRIITDFDKIPSDYLLKVKKMMVSFRGESHGVAYQDGMVMLNDLNPDYACSVDAGEAYTDKHLRVDRAGWLGEKEWFTWFAYPADSRPAEKDVIKSYIRDYADAGHPVHALGFAWCWDHTNGGTTGNIDPVLGVFWYGFSVGGPDGNVCWGLDAGDFSLTGNHVSMDTYLNATMDYINFCKSNSYITKIVFTTCPVDNNWPEELYSGAKGYQGHVKQEYIRNFVRADTSRILFDYADILCYDDNGSLTTSSWNGHTFPSITPTNLGDATIGHIGQAGAIRLAKAQWWMLARIAGWNGE